jgi:alanyl-tRNA synthetase
MNQITTQLYNDDSHMQSFQSTVITCIEQINLSNEKVYIVSLDATAFFPEGGGQPSDKGSLGDAEILDVQEDDGIIYHTVSAPLTIGETVTGTINWAIRFDLMQHHTAEHIVSGLVHKYFGYDNVGFHMGSEAITVDFNGILTEADLKKVELEANKAVYENLPIEVRFPSKEELNTMNYRSKKELTGDVRIVTIPGYDVCACCAPHVNLTGEIGLIKITSCQKYKSGVRISMLSGARALTDYNQKEKSVADISVLLSAKPFEVQEAVKHLKEDNLSLKGQISTLQNQLLKYKAETVKEGTDSLYIFDNAIPASLLRNYGNLLMERCKGLCAVFTSEDNNSYKYILVSKSIDVRPYAKQINETFDGKGGGSKEMVQGSLTGNKEMLEEFMSGLSFVS